MPLPQEIIRTIRDGNPLSAEFIHEFIRGITHDSVSDAQVAAFCMAILLRGFSFEETAALTTAMAQSGTTLHWGELAAHIVDKHSTGGVGDKVSLMLAPMVAACGLHVPMIAGRGLGHTGGTIDKLETIPGFRTDLAIDRFQHFTREIGCSIIGQTGEFAPADKRVYAVRDVTGTVESVSLITASILSKKLAAGLHGLVLDVKCGNGAFMDNPDKARELGLSIKNTAREAGLTVVPVISDMSQVLGRTAGNSVEVQESVDYLTGAHREPRLHRLTVTLAAHMLILGGAESDLDAARLQIEEKLNNGAAAEHFARMVTAQGGPSDFIDNATAYLGHAPIMQDIVATQDGYLSSMDTRDIGLMLVRLKAGRSLVTDVIDPHIGLTDIAPLGTTCEAGKTVLARVHLRNKEDEAFAQSAYQNAMHYSADTPVIPDIIIDTL